ncbi:MAG: hypothetical protein Q4D02_03220 [Clostridia bacterium]|nr:hypothetical protein [Clostridia bacterium]
MSKLREVSIIKGENGENILKVLLSNHRCLSLKIRQILEDSIEIEIEDGWEDYMILSSLYRCKEEVESYIRKNIPDKERFSLEYVIRYFKATGYQSKSKISYTDTLDEICIEKYPSGRIGLKMKLEKNLCYYSGYEYQVYLSDIKDDTIYITYETYISTRIFSDVTSLIRYQKEIEEYVKKDCTLFGNLKDFHFWKILVHVEYKNENFEISTSISSDELRKMLKEKNYIFHNDMPRYICDGESTFILEFDQLSEIVSILSSESYINDYFIYFNYDSFKEQHFKIEYEECRSGIHVNIFSKKMNMRYRIGTITIQDERITARECMKILNEI